MQPESCVGFSSLPWMCTLKKKTHSHASRCLQAEADDTLEQLIMTLRAKAQLLSTRGRPNLLGASRALVPLVLSGAPDAPVELSSETHWQASVGPGQAAEPRYCRSVPQVIIIIS